MNARKSRRKVLEDCAGSGALLMPAHFGAPFLCHVDERGSVSRRASREAVTAAGERRFNADRTGRACDMGWCHEGRAGWLTHAW